MATYGVRLERSDQLRLAPHPTSPSEVDFVGWCQSTIDRGRRLAVDLFSGAGGLSLGLERAGWTVAAAADHDPRSVETHRANFPGRTVRLDLGEPANRKDFVDALAGVEIDLVAGGPPCQPYSRAGSSKIRSLVASGSRPSTDPRRELWRAFLDTAIRLQPRAVLMENVPDMGLNDDFRTVRSIVAELEVQGYATEVRIIDTWKYSVPQHRRRMILLARRDGGGFTWPPELDPTAPVTVGDAILDLPELGESTGDRELPYSEPGSLNAFAREMRLGAQEGVIHDHFTRPVRDDDREIFTFMKPGMLYTEVPEHLRRYSTRTFDDKYKRLSSAELSRTITAHIAKDGYWYIHPTEARTLTVREAARLQTFPDWFRFAGHRSDAFRQIGNAVPPLAGEAAAMALTPRTTCDRRSENGATEATAPDSSYTLLAAHRVDWPAVHEDLASWAYRQRSGSWWLAFPGPEMTVVVAAAVALLARSYVVPDADRPVLDVLRGRTVLDRRTLDDCLQIAPVRSRRRLARLSGLVEMDLGGDSPGDDAVDRVVDVLHLPPAQSRQFRLLLGQDVILPSTAAVRVAARFLGVEDFEQNMLTEGRIQLARLIGTGADTAPLRMAALRQIAATLCGTNTRLCAACPLRVGCVDRHRAQPGAAEPAGLRPGSTSSPTDGGLAAELAVGLFA